MFKIKRNRTDGGVVNKYKQSMSVCHPDKPLQARGMCKNCYDKWLKENNPEYVKRQLENSKKWVIENKEKNKNNQKKWRAKQDPLYNRRKTLHKYGMTLEDYDTMLYNQGGVCSICKKEPNKNKRLHVDHDHKTGLVRGLLCFRCNFGLSYFNEDVGIAENIYNYLKDHHEIIDNRLLLSK